MSDTEEAPTLADIKTNIIPVAELERLLELNTQGTLHDKQTTEEYLKGGHVCTHQIVYYGDPIEMIKTREKQGLQPTSIDSVKTTVHQFDVTTFNKLLLKRANNEATRQRRRGTVLIRKIDEQGAKDILAKVEGKLLTLETRDKPAITKALMEFSTETQNVKDDVFENLQAIGYLTRDETDGVTNVSYKLPKIPEFVKRLLEYHKLMVESCCSSPENEYDGDLAKFESQVQCTISNHNLQHPGLELVKLETLKALDVLEHMGKNRPKTLASLERVLQPVAWSVAITPLNRTFAKLLDLEPALKFVNIPFGDPPVYPFSLLSEGMFAVPWKPSQDTAKETKRFCQRVFSNFKRAHKKDKNIQLCLADEASQVESVKSLQQWLQNREKRIESECEKDHERANATSDVLTYNLSCLTSVKGFKPLTREDIYGILARMANVEVTYSEEEVVKRLEELGALKSHPDKVVFFVKKIRKLIQHAETMNKKVSDYVSKSLKEYYPDLKSTDKKEK